MEHKKILNLLNEASDSRFATRKWNIVNDVGIEIIYNTEVLKSKLCDYNDTYILVRGDIAVVAAGNREVTQAGFENCAKFTRCITKIDETTIDDSEGFDLVKPIYNLIEYNSNYYDTTDSLRFFF